MMTTENKQNQELDLINQYKIAFEQNKTHINLINESSLDQLDLNLKPFIRQTTKPRSNKNIEILYALITNSVKNYAPQDDSKVSLYLAQHGINLAKMDRDLQELRSQIKTSYNILQAEQIQEISEKYFHNYQTERRQVDNQNFYFTSVKDELNMDVENLRIIQILKEYLTFENELTTGFKSITPLKERIDTTNYPVTTLTSIKPMIASPEDSETFDRYFKYMKLFFYFKTFHKIIPENPDMIFSQSELSGSNHVIPIKTVLYYLKDQFDDFRKNLFALLFTQIDNRVRLTSRSLLVNTIKFYENQFFKKLSKESGVVYTDKDKIEIISQHVNHINYYKINVTRSMKQDKLKNWGIIYYLIRSGFEDLALTYARKLNDTDLSIFSDVYSQVIYNKEINSDLYSQLVTVIKSKDEDLTKTNPYKYYCLMLATRIPIAIDYTLLDTQEEYLWFYLKFVNITDNLNNIGYGDFLTLKELQDYILSDMKKTSVESALVCFSLLLYEEGLKLLPKNNYFIDIVNLMTLLNELRLYRNITYINETPIEEYIINIDNFYKTNVDQFITNYMPSKPKETVNYIRFLCDNYVEKISQLKDLSILKNPHDTLYSVKDSSVSLNNILNDSEIKDIVTKVVTSKAITDIETIAALAKDYRMYKELIKIILLDIITNLFNKIPKKLSRNKPHALKTDSWYSTSITEKYSDQIKELSSISNTLDETSRYNIKILMQLKYIEEIYGLISSDKEEEALKVLVYLTLDIFGKNKLSSL
jgi:hypothetical protein